MTLPEVAMHLQPTTPSTLFVALADPPAERDDEFNEWYDTIHGPDALANGSFTAMHRFRAVGGGHRAAARTSRSGRAGSRPRARRGATSHREPKRSAMRDGPATSPPCASR